MSFLRKKKKFLVFFLVLFLFFQHINVAIAEEQNPLGQSSDATQLYIDQINQQHQGMLDASTGGGSETWLTKLGWQLNSVFQSITFGLPLFLLTIIGAVVWSFSSFLVGLAAFLLNISIDLGIYQLANIVNNTDIIKSSWLIFRNLANVGLIFALIFIAIQVVLRTSGYEAKKLLGRVVVAALLINFSFFFAALVVDVSNLMSIEIYEEVAKVTDKNNNGDTDFATFLFEKVNVSIFSSLLLSQVDSNYSNVLDYLSTVGSNVTKGDGNWGTNLITTLSTMGMGVWLGAILNLVVCFIFVAIAGMIIGRLIAILLLLVVAPLGFAGMVLPSTEKMAREWRESLIGHSFFLPVFMLFLLVAVKIIDKLDSIDFTKNKAMLVQDQAAIVDFTGIAAQLAPHAVKFALIIGLLIAGLQAAKKVSSGGSAAIGKISASVASSVSGGAFAGAAFAGRNTIGAGASAALKNEKVQNFMRSNPLVGGTLGKSLEGIAKSTFDARNSRTFKGVASATGVGGDFAKSFKPAKDGFKGQTDRLSKSMQSTYNAIPDKKESQMDSTIVTKYNDEKTELNRLENEVKELERKGTAATDPTLIAAKGAVETQKKAFETARDAYERDKNFAKASLIQSPDMKPNAINFWLAPAQNDVREKVKQKFREGKKDNKEHQELLKAIRESAKSGDK